MKSNSLQIIFIFPLLLVLAEIAGYLANDMYLPALPQLAYDLNITYHLAQLTLTAWFFGSASIQLILGPISDRYGRRPVMLIGILIYVITSIICAISSNINIIITARLFQGATICAIVVAGYASIHELLQQKQAIKTIAWMNSIIVLAPAFGPMLGALVLLIGNWRSIFWFLGVWQAIVALLLFKYMPESRPDDGLYTLRIRSILKNYFNIIKNKSFILNTAVFCIIFSTMIVWIVAGPFLVIKVFHFNTLIYAVFQAMVFLSFIVATRLVNFFMQRFNINQLINICIAITAIGAVIAIPLTYFKPQWLLGLIITLMIYTFGSGLCFAPLNRMAIEACKEPMGSRMAMFSFLMTFFGFLATVYVNIFYHNTLISIALFMLATIIIATILRLLYIRL